ncbi:amino acid ABC transporter permease [Psychrobacillus sp. NPDC093180]|uniref:amino acid ABC transporter permease n=1 Tax=Psychrobacillus sp. NPDC093180 TaxID=3364489 RepID=UPI00381C4498
MDIWEAYSLANIIFLLRGLLVTLQVALISIILSFFIGSLIGIIRYVNIKLLSPLLMFVIEIIRNLPILLIIFFTYFALPEVGIKLSTVNAAIVALTLFHSAMFSEVVRSGLKSIEKGQKEAALSTGLNTFQTLWHIIIPQGFRRMVPPIVSQFITLVKDTSLAVIISLPELTRSSQIIYGQSYNYFIPIIILVALTYFLINYSLSLLSKKLELKQI